MVSNITIYFLPCYLPLFTRAISIITHCLFPHHVNCLGRGNMRQILDPIYWFICNVYIKGRLLFPCPGPLWCGVYHCRTDTHVIRCPTRRRRAFIHRDMLTRGGRPNMATISQTIPSNALSWLKIVEFGFEFHWILFLVVQMTRSRHWFGAKALSESMMTSLLKYTCFTQLQPRQRRSAKFKFPSQFAWQILFNVILSSKLELVHRDVINSTSNVVTITITPYRMLGVWMRLRSGVLRCGKRGKWSRIYFGG